MASGKSNTNVLVIDSATSILRIGFKGKDDKIHQLESHDQYRHAEFIFSLIDKVLSDAGTTIAQLEGLVVSTGPGSFTGLRVGMAAAKGLGVSLGIPVAAISIYEALAAKFSLKDAPVAVLIPSRRNEFYLGYIESNKFDNARISVVLKDELINISRTTKMQFIDFDPAPLNLPPQSDADSHICLLSTEDYLAASGEFFKRGGCNLERLEPIYVQKFPARVPK